MGGKQHKKQVGARHVARQKGQIIHGPKQNWTIGNGVIVSKVQYSPGSTRVEGTADGKPFAVDL